MNYTSTEARERLPNKEQQRTDAQSTDRSVAPKQGRFDDLTATNRLLKGNGIAKGDGIAFSELEPLVGKPGLAKLERTIAALDAEIETLRATLARWPTPDTTHPYRFTGARFKHTQDGRFLEPGDVMDLTETQAHAWRDRFEAVVGEPEPATA